MFQTRFTGIRERNRFCHATASPRNITRQSCEVSSHNVGLRGHNVAGRALYPDCRSNLRRRGIPSLVFHQVACSSWPSLFRQKRQARFATSRDPPRHTSLSIISNWHARGAGMSKWQERDRRELSGGGDPVSEVRFSAETTAKIDKWGEKHEVLRSEAIRYLSNLG